MLRKSLLYQALSSLVLCLSITTGATAERSAVADDGREILLKDDGSWDYKSSDRFATAEDGTRVRLGDDGRWQVVGNAPVVREELVRTPRLEVTLEQAVMEIFRAKLIKSTRFDAQTVLQLAVVVSSHSDPVAAHLSHYNLFRVEDSRGREYPVIAVTPQHQQLQPGESFHFSVRTDGAPVGLLAMGTNNLVLTIDKTVFGTESDLKFSKRLDDLIEKKVDRPFR